MRLSPGEKLGHFEVNALIGKGGMGEVYRGTDTRLGRPVAIKVSSREFNDRFEREARAISSLNHPNICTLYDVGPNYLVMEFVEGELLSDVIARGPLPLDRALAYAAQIVDALAAAHAKGIVHRDLKPGNIIVTKNGVMLDFGLAKLGGTWFDRKGQVAGWDSHHLFGRQLGGHAFRESGQRRRRRKGVTKDTRPDQCPLQLVAGRPIPAVLYGEPSTDRQRSLGIAVGRRKEAVTSARHALQRRVRQFLA